jgi:transcriptional regulator with XRE-family HTH domain
MEKSIYTDEYSAVTDLLKELRKAAGITQVQMAEMLEQTQSLFSKYERGEIRLDVIQLRTIVLKLGLTLTEFAAHLEKRLHVPKTQASRRSKSSTRR